MTPCIGLTPTQTLGLLVLCALGFAISFVLGVVFKSRWRG